MKMPKKQGSCNYSYAEQIHLVTEVGRVLPTEQSDWDAVAAGFNANITSCKRFRDTMILKRKFNSLWRAYERTEECNRTTLQTLAHEVKYHIDKRPNRRLSSGQSSPQSSPRVVDTEAELSSYQIAEGELRDAQQNSCEPENDGVSSSSLPICRTDAAEGDAAAQSFLDSSASSVQSCIYDSDVMLGYSASMPRERYLSAVMCNCVKEFRSLEQQLSRYRTVVIQELKKKSDLERNERKRERTLDMRSARRYQRQLQECVLALLN